MKKITIMSVLLLFGVFFMTGCSAKPLADSFDEEQVIETAKKAVEYLDAGDYQTFSDELVDESIKDKLSADILASAVSQTIPDRGAFQDFDSITTMGKDDSAGNACAIVVAVAKYESQKVVYTITFNQDMKIISFYLK